MCIKQASINQNEASFAFFLRELKSPFWNLFVVTPFVLNAHKFVQTRQKWLDGFSDQSALFH
jgi:hypothetical protein